MTEASIPVNLFNPGQVFACLGFLEAADVLLGDAEGRFDWSQSESPRFSMRGAFEGNPFDYVTKFLLSAEYTAISPLSEICERDGGTTCIVPHLFPCAFRDDKGKPRNALLPIRAKHEGKALLFDLWCDLDSGRPKLQLWTATNGNSAWVRLSKLLAACKTAAENPRFHLDPLNSGAVVAANFRFEMRRNWTAIGAGFSPDRINKQSAAVHIDILSYPFVEVLASYGLSHSRPCISKAQNDQRLYGCWDLYLPTPLARIAIQSDNIFSRRCFKMHLEAPNDGGDLSIAGSEELAIKT